jgi:hypothetical protein
MLRNSIMILILLDNCCICEQYYTKSVMLSCQSTFNNDAQEVLGLTFGSYDIRPDLFGI